MRAIEICGTNGTLCRAFHRELAGLASDALDGAPLWLVLAHDAEVTPSTADGALKSTFRALIARHVAAGRLEVSLVATTTLHTASGLWLKAAVADTARSSLAAEAECYPQSSTSRGCRSIANAATNRTMPSGRASRSPVLRGPVYCPHSSQAYTKIRSGGRRGNADQGHLRRRKSRQSPLPPQIAPGSPAHRESRCPQAENASAPRGGRAVRAQSQTLRHSQTRRSWLRSACRSLNNAGAY
eukprot:6635329-Prymnesium_polylepis.5